MPAPRKAPRNLSQRVRTSRLLSPVRQTKHLAFVAAKRGRAFSRDLANDLHDLTSPYVFDPGRYPLSFVSLPTKPTTEQAQHPVPHRIFVAWTGDNDMSQARRAGLKSIRESNRGCEIVLVTPRTIDRMVVADHPMHDAYEHLSLVHRSDYLRAYLLHHHGGGYSDIKPHPTAWAPAFVEINSEADSPWVIGYRLPSTADAAVVDGPIGRDIHRHYRRLIGSGALIARAGSPLTREWLAEVERRLDYYRDLLKRSPGNVWGDNTGYPVPWTALGSQVLEPLCLKYLPHVRINQVVKPQLFDHR